VTSGRKQSFSRPTHLDATHDLSGFDSGAPELDDWLRRRARANEAQGASRTYVVTAGRSVAGYYALATGSVAIQDATGSVRRNMPDPVPVVILARLAVDARYQRQGIGAGLVKDAVLRTIQAADIVGARAMLIHALSDEAKKFYEKWGFKASDVDPMTLMLTIAELKRTIGA
jgi:GNAT superfamily N-acetyltransferase